MVLLPVQLFGLSWLAFKTHNKDMQLLPALGILFCFRNYDLLYFTIDHDMQLLPEFGDVKF
jgi:hypothetical protein